MRIPLTSRLGSPDSLFRGRFGWTSVFGSERLTGALLDRLTHHVHILEMNGESFRLATAKKAQRRTGHAPTATAKTTSEGDDDPKN